ncbi:histidinol dehydrogenase [Pseudothermotoga sp.]|uniref:histidinol dehydrogenase n=1 Tax=Pseudothermotoga sp. TaxID=2033661 RepID=UPI0031F6CFA9
MKVLIEPTCEQIEEIVRKRRFELSQLEQNVKSIVEDVKKNGQVALEKYIAMYERCALEKEQIVVSKQELESVQMDEQFEQMCERFIESVEKFHSLQLERSIWRVNEFGSFTAYLVKPIESVAIYVPAGKRVYFSTLVMCAVPAKLAGVERIVVTCSAMEDGKISPHVLYLCRRLGIEEIYKMGGAHAISALAYGTTIVKKVDKIVGPGNIYVSCAKKLILGDCGIDSIAGPTELLIVADGSAKARFVASDMLAQAEHDENATVCLITNDEDVLDETMEELSKQLSELDEPARSTARSCLERNGLAILVKDIKDAVKISNIFSPEHLQLMTEDPWSLLSGVKNAGSIFLGSFSAEAFGDYGIGPNHVLPTSTASKFSSGLTVQDFLKKIFVTQISEEEVRQKGTWYASLARLEGFEAHARSIEVRLEGSR